MYQEVTLSTEHLARVKIEREREGLILPYLATFRTFVYSGSVLLQ